MVSLDFHCNGIRLSLNKSILLPLKKFYENFFYFPLSIYEEQKLYGTACKLSWNEFEKSEFTIMFKRNEICGR